MGYNADFLARRRNEWKNNISTFEFYENSLTVSGENIIAMIDAPNQGRSGTISQVRAYDFNRSLIGTWTVSIERSGIQNALFKLTLPIREV